MLSRWYGVFIVANDKPRISSPLNTNETRMSRGRRVSRDGWDARLRVTNCNGVVRLQEKEEETRVGTWFKFEE